MGKPSIYKQNSQSYINVIKELHNIYIKSSYDLEKKLIWNAVVDVLRKKSEYETPRYISIKANEYFNQNNIKRITKHGDIHDINAQLKITLEHCNPINKLVERLLINGESISNVVQDNFTAIITKEEDKCLDTNFRRERPNGWEQAYKESGIEWTLY